MALLYPGAIPASGKVGDKIYARNRGGAYVRAMSGVTNPRTALQQAVRGVFGVLSTTWNSLDPLDQQSWTDWANNTTRINRLGYAVLLTGNQAYVGANALRSQMGKARVDNMVGPNLLARLTMPETITLASGTPNAVALVGLTASDEWQGVGGALGLYVSTPQNASIKFFKGPYQFAGQLNGGTATLAAGTINVSQAMISGQQTFFRLIGTAPDGRPTQTLYGGKIVI